MFLFQSRRAKFTILITQYPILNQVTVNRIASRRAAAEACGRVLSITRGRDEATSHNTVKINFDTEQATHQFLEHTKKAIRERHSVSPTIYTEEQRQLIDSETDEHSRRLKISNNNIESVK